MNPLFKNVTIIGVGLIGGSLGMSICSRRLAEKVTGYDIDAANLDLAVKMEAIHNGETNLERAVADADLIIVCTPVGNTIEIIRKISAVIKNGCIVTDVGSTKSRVVSEAEKIIPPHAAFVGGHPMAGSEIDGVKGADQSLLENAVYILTPGAEQYAQAALQVRGLITALGAKVVVLDPAEHDMMIAGVSHLPHLVATTLVNTVASFQNEYEEILMLAAGGFRDTTRIASGHPLMWKDICISNKEPILHMIDRFKEFLEKTRELVEQCDGQGLEKEFVTAREIRNNIPEKMRGYLPLVHEIIVTVPDQPGVIGSIAGALGAEGINIVDIEILRVREGQGGTMRMALSSEEGQARALEIMKHKGISAKKKIV